ncbi:hypothetical protein GCM10020331_074180 [Ectobacillus funiculus]
MKLKGKEEGIYMVNRFWLLMTILWCMAIYLFTATPSFTSENTKDVVQETVQTSYHAPHKDTNDTKFYLTTDYLNQIMRKISTCCVIWDVSLLNLEHTSF